MKQKMRGSSEVSHLPSAILNTFYLLSLSAAKNKRKDISIKRSFPSTNKNQERQYKKKERPLSMPVRAADRRGYKRSHPRVLLYPTFSTTPDWADL
jgi:hypothetical protein